MANQQADGNIIIDTQIDSKGFEADSKEMRQAVKQLGSKMESLGPVFQKAISGNASALSTFKGEADTLQDTISSIEDKMSEIADKEYPLQEYTRVNTEIEKTEKELDKLKSKQAELKALGKDKSTSNEYKSVQKELSKTESKMDSLKAKAAALDEGPLKKYYEELTKVADARDKAIKESNSVINNPKSTDRDKGIAKKKALKAEETFAFEKYSLDIGYSKQLKEAEALDTELAELNRKYTEQKSRLEELKSSGAIDGETEAWKKVQHGIDVAENDLQEYKNQKQQLENSGQATVKGVDTQAYKEMNTQLQKSKNKLGEMNNEASKANGFAARLKGAFSKVAGVVGAGLKKGMTAFIGKIKSAHKASDGIHKKFLKIGLALVGMRGLMGGIKQLVSSAMSSNEQLQNQLTTVKGVLGQAIAPIINVLIKGLATLVTFADRLYSIFTGMSLISKYNAKQTAKASSNLGSAASNAKKLTRQLAGFDELNVLSDSSSDSSGGGGGGDTATFDPVDLSAEMQDFIDQFKKLWSEGDFEGIGALISSKIVGVLQGINWDDIKKKAFKGGKSFAEILNGLFEYSDTDGNTLMSSIGKTIGEAFNTLLSVVDGFAANLHWANLGYELANGISTTITSIDWKLLFKTAIDLGEGFGDYINGIFEYKDKDGNSLAKNLGKGLSNAIHAAFLFVMGFVETINWQNIGKAIADFIQGIDWVQLTDDLLTLISDLCIALLDACIGLIEGIDWAKAVDDLFAMIGKIFTSVDWAGLASKLSQLLGDLVGAAFAILGQLTIDIAEFVQKIIDSIKDYFSQYFSWDDEPADVINGLLKGIGDAIKNVGTWIDEHIIQPFLEGVRKGFGIHSPSTVMAEIGGYLIDGLKNGIGNIWNKIKEKFTEFKTSVTTWFSDRATDFKNKGSGLIEKVKEGIGNIWSTIKENFDTFKTNLSNWFTGKAETFKKFGSNTVSKIKTGIGSIWGSFKEKFDTFKTNLSNWFSGKAETFKKFGSNTISKIKSGIGNIWSSIKEKFDAFKTNLSNWFSGKAESFKSLGKNIIAGIKKGITDKIGEIKTALTNGLSSALTSVKKLLGIHSPSRVFRDEVGQFIALGIGTGITGNMQEVVKDTATLAGAIQNELNSKEYAIKPISADGANVITAGMDSFAGIITDGFTRLIDRLESIARGVSFTMPIAANIVPYHSKDSNSIDWHTLLEDSNDDLISALMQISQMQTDELRQIIEGLDLTVNVDDRAITDMVIKEIKRRTLVTKKNPLLT